LRLWEGRKLHHVHLAKYYLGDQIKKNEWEDNIKMDIQEVGWVAWTGLIWPRIETGGRLL